MAGFAITQLSLSQFRSHARTRLSLDGRAVVLIGANGAGKTNVLEAVSLLSPGRGLRRAGAGELARRPGGHGWKIAAGIRGGGTDHEVETGAAPGEARQVRVDGKAATQSTLGRLLRMVWLQPAMDRLWIEGTEGRRRYLDRMTLGFRPDHAESTLAYERAMRERNRLLRDGVTDAGWYGALEVQMAQNGAEIAANRAHALNRLQAAQRGAQSIFPRAALAVVSPDDAHDDLATALAEGRRRDMAAGRTLVGPHRADLSAVYEEKAMPAGLCSTGEQKALLISLILANARALEHEVGAVPVLLLDEIAAHLDAERRGAFYDELAALGAQALMTGTDAALFAGLGPDVQRFLVEERDGASHIEEITP